MTITLDHVACVLHLPIRGKLLDHFMIKRDEAHDMMVIYLGANPTDSLMQCESTRGTHVKISYLYKLYEDKLELVNDTDDDDLQVTYHRECALRCYLIFLVGMSVFVEKSVTYVDVAIL